MIALAFVVLGARAIAASPPRAEQLARAIRLERIDFNQATLQEALEFLGKKAQEQLEGGRTIKLRAAAPSWVRLSFSHKGISLFAVLEEISGQTALILRADNDSLSLHVPGEESPVPHAKRPSEEANIYEAALRYINGNSKTVSYYLQIGCNDPTEAFIRRFANSGPEVKKWSEAAPDRNPRKSWLSLGSPRWSGPAKVQVSYTGTGSESEFELTHTTRGWFVTKDTLLLIE